MRFPHFAGYPFEGIDEHIYTIQQFFRTQQGSVMKSRFQKQLPELLKVLSTGNVGISVQKLSFKFPHVEKQWDDVMVVHKLRKQKLHDYLLPYKEKLLCCDATIAQTLSDQDVLYLLMCTCDIATHAEYQFSWKGLEKDAVTLRIKENLVKTLNKQPSALELQYQAKNEKTTGGRSKSGNITKELHTLFGSGSVEGATIQKSKKAVEEQPGMKKLPLIGWDKYFAQGNQGYKQITGYFEEYTALNKNYMKKDMHFLLNSLTAYLSACFTDITFLIDNQENTKTTLTKNRSYYWLKTEIEYMERMRRVGNYQMIEAKIMKQSAEMWIQQFEGALSGNKDDETEGYVNEIGDSLEEKKDALGVQWISVYEPYILSLYKSYHALGRASGKSLKREEIMQYVQKNILHDYCTTHLKMYMLLHKNHQEMVRFWKSKMLVEQLFDQQNNQLSGDQKITVDHVGFIVESLWQGLFGTSFDRERYITILSQQKSTQSGDQGNDEMINYQERNDHGDEQNRANTYEGNTVSPEDEIESVELTVIEKVDKLLKELPNQYTDIACANYIQTIGSLFDELLAIIDHNNLSKSELVTVTLIQHVCDYTVDLQKKYKILSDWRYSFVTMVTPLVKKKSVAGVENEEVKQWIQDKDVLGQIQKHVSTFFAGQTNADLSVEVDDVVQEIVIRLLRNQSSFVGTKTQFKAWVARITRNMCIDFHRKQSKSSAMYVKPVDNKQRDTLYLTQLENTIDHSKNKGDIIEQDEMSIQLKWAIEQLPSEQRDVILLRHYADMPFNEIAKVMGVSINTALGRMRYALINLRRIPVIQQYFFGDCGHGLRLIQREGEGKERSTKKIIDTFIHQETSGEERNTYKQSTTKNTYVIHDLFYEDEVADTTNIFAGEEQEDIVMTQEMYYDVFEYLSTFDYLYLYSFYQRIAYDHLGEAGERYMSDFLDFGDTFIKSIGRSLLKKTTTGEYIRNKIQLWTQQPYDVAIKEFESLPLQYRKTCLEELKNTIISPTD